MMLLDLNHPDNEGHGKYALILLRRLDDCRSGTFGELPKDMEAALKLLTDEGIIDLGLPLTKSEFFVIRLKDRFAQDALDAYAHAAVEADHEWSEEVRALARRAPLRCSRAPSTDPSPA